MMIVCSVLLVGACASEKTVSCNEWLGSCTVTTDNDFPTWISDHWEHIILGIVLLGFAAFQIFQKPTEGEDNSRDDAVRLDSHRRIITAVDAPGKDTWSLPSATYDYCLVEGRWDW